MDVVLVGGGGWVQTRAAVGVRVSDPNHHHHHGSRPSQLNASSLRESTSYTSLVATGERSGFVVYSRHKPPGPDVAFAMPFWIDDGDLVEWQS